MKRSIFATLCLFFLLPLGKAQLPQTPPQAVIDAARSSFEEYDNGLTFDEIARDNKRDPILVTKSFNPSPGGGVFHPGKPISTHLERLINSSDLAGVGTPVKRWTYSLNGGKFTVSIYLVRMAEIAFGGSENIGTGSNIYIARAGGPVEWEGRQVRAIETDFRLFHLNQPYLFFAKNIGIGIYKVDSEHTLEIHGNEVAEASTSKRHANYFQGKTYSAILKEAFSDWEQEPLKAKEPK